VPWRFEPDSLSSPVHFVSNAESPSVTSAPKRPLSLGVIFLTLYIDLIGFSIIFPLGPDLLEHYLKLEGRTGTLGWLVGQTDALAQAFGIANTNFSTETTELNTPPKRTGA
jgi:hypothetical protein